MPLLREFSDKYPDIELELGLEDRFVDLIAERIDVAIRIGHLQDSSLVARRLGELNWQITASPDYLARYGAPKSPQDLSKHACLYYRSNKQSMSSWPFLNDNGNVDAVKVQGPLTINDACALVDAAIAGIGILLIDKALLGDAIAQGKLIPILTDYRLAPGVPVYAIYPARDFLPAKTIAFVDFLLEKLSPLLR
jgi:DNA-binding transcriptional LysR family regulator